MQILLGGQVQARNTYCYCSFFKFIYFSSSPSSSTSYPDRLSTKENTYLQTSHELETCHVLRT